MVNQIYSPELQLIKANTSDTEAPFLDLHLSISNGFVSSQIYNKRDDFDFDIYTWKKVREHPLCYEGKLWTSIILQSKYVVTKLFS